MTAQAGGALCVKKCLDRAVAVGALALAVPVIAAGAASVALTMGRPVFFHQLRPGYKGKLFKIHKLRTMMNARSSDGELLDDERRLTRVGRILRATSIDELPQLWNVVAGELSLVGPRPLLVEYIGRYSSEQARRHDVMPGITGWAQVHGRNLVDWHERFRLDVWYVDHWSLLLDLKILVLTIRQVLKRDGVTAAGFATMPEFSGFGPETPGPEPGVCRNT